MTVLIGLLNLTLTAATAVLVSASTWRVFNRAAVAEAYAEPALSGTAQPEYGRRPADRITL